MDNLDQRLVCEFLRSRLGGEITAPEVLGGGEWSKAFGFVCAERPLVARFGAYVDDFEKDRAAMRFSSPAMPVPRVLEIVPAFDGHCCISERMFGGMLEDLDAAGWQCLLPAMLRLLDALREADFAQWTAAVGAPNGTWKEQLLSVDEENDRVHGWHDLMASSPTGMEPYRRGLAFLRDHIEDCPEGDYLLHNDLLHYNVLAVDDRITGVFDWGCAGRGDFLYELSHFTFYAPWFPAMGSVDWLGSATAHYREIALAVPDLLPRLRCYEIHHGLGGMAYCAFIRDEGELERHACRTMGLLGG